MWIRYIYLSALAWQSSGAFAQDRCMAQYQTEQLRIERAAAQQRPVKGDTAAEHKWAKTMHAALALAAKTAEQCKLDNKPPVPAAVLAKEQDCIASLHRRATELNQKYQGKSPSTTEQIAHRAENDKLIEDRMKCSRRP